MKVRLPKQQNQAEMMKQLAQVQEDMAKRQEELDQTEFTATSGGGVVTAVVTGAKLLKSVKITKEAVDPDDVEMLEDLICAAVNEALETAEKTVSEQMNKITAGLNMPGML